MQLNAETEIQTESRYMDVWTGRWRIRSFVHAQYTSLLRIPSYPWSLRFLYNRVNLIELGGDFISDQRMPKVNENRDNRSTTKP